MMAAGHFTKGERAQHELPGIAGGRLNVPANSNIQAVWKLNEIELRHNLEGEASWHWQYRNSSYIYIGGLDVRLTEGDIIVVFSQWGEPIDIHLVRDKRTGIPKGFAFLAYEDQRSTILAVDNANGMQLLQHTLRVDHCKHYRPPEKHTSQERETTGDIETAYEATGAEGKGLGVYGVTKDQQKRTAAEKQAEQLLEQNRMQENKRAAAMHRQGIKDVDEMWCEEFEEMLQQMNKEAEAEAQQQLEAEAAQRKERQKKLEEQAKKEWKREWKQQREAQKKEKKRKKKHEHSDCESSENSRERVKRKERKKEKRERARREEDEFKYTYGDGCETFKVQEEKRLTDGSRRKELRGKENDKGSSRQHSERLMQGDEEQEADEGRWRKRPDREKLVATQYKGEGERGIRKGRYEEEEEAPRKRRRSASAQGNEEEGSHRVITDEIGERKQAGRSLYGGSEREGGGYRATEKEERDKEELKEQTKMGTRRSAWSTETRGKNESMGCENAEALSEGERDRERSEARWEQRSLRRTSEEGRQQWQLNRRNRTVEDKELEYQKKKGGEGELEQQNESMSSSTSCSGSCAHNTEEKIRTCTSYEENYTVLRDGHAKKQMHRNSKKIFRC